MNRKTTSEIAGEEEGEFCYVILEPRILCVSHSCLRFFVDTARYIRLVLWHLSNCF